MCGPQSPTYQAFQITLVSTLNHRPEISLKHSHICFTFENALREQKSLTLLISMNAATNSHLFLFAFRINVVTTKAASMVLRPRLNPNCSSPRKPSSSAIFVMRSHILTVTNLRMLDGIVMGRYCEASSESPP